MSETASAAAESNEPLIIPGAGHGNLSDESDKIPFDRNATFFEKNLK